MLLATYEDFENGGLYDNYRRYPFFSMRAEWLTEQYPDSETFLIVGCGWGFLVDELRLLGKEAWGVELSDYAIRAAQREVPDSFRYIEKADGMKANDLITVGPGVFDVAVSEDVFPVLANLGQMQKMHRAMMKVSDRLVHFVTEGDASRNQDNRCQWHGKGWYGEQFKEARIVTPEDIARPRKR